MARMNPEYSVNTKRYPIVAGLLVTTLLACRGPVESALPAGALAQAHLDARACDQGDPLSCNNLAASFEAGDTVTVDPARAAELYDQACTQNAFLACSNLAGLLLEGVVGDGAKLRVTAGPDGLEVRPVPAEAQQAA